MRLIADIGGTNARFAWSRAPGEFDKLVRFPVGDYATFEAALDAFLVLEPPHNAVEEAAVAAAGPLQGDEIRLTNGRWRVRLDALRDRLGTERVALVNDFVAVGHAVPHLDDSDLVPIGHRMPNRDGTESLLAIGPGTGLGLCLIVPDGKRGWLINSTEAGHVRLAAVSQSQWDLFERLPDLASPPCAEDVLSGPGLARLHRALGGPSLTPEAVSLAARRGDQLACCTVVDWFECLGRFAGDAVLVTGGVGGVLFAGAIVRELHEFVEDEVFRRAFEGSGRMTDLLRQTATAVIGLAEPGLSGLTYADIPTTRSRRGVR